MSLGSSNLLERAERCTYESYLKLAKCLPAHENLSKVGLYIARSAKTFAFSNFIGLTRTSEVGVHELVELVNQIFQGHRPNVFVITNGSPDSMRKEMVEGGFAEHYQLAVLAKLSDSDLPVRDLERATTRSERRNVARFMADSFFTTLAVQQRQSVITSTAESELDLVALPNCRDRNLQAAAMFAVFPEEVGIFNVCVARRERGRGVGSDLMSKIESLPDVRGKAMCLQCHEELVGWYTALGFKRAGTLYCWRPDFVI